MSGFVQADGQLLIAIQNLLVCDALTPVMKFITFFGEWGAFWLGLCIVLICFRRTRKLGVLALVSLFIGFVICNVCLKPLVERPRPWTLFDEVTRLTPDPGDWSFPSGHTTSSFATATAILLNSGICGFRRRYGIAAVTLAALVGLSRLYLGMHFPSDVLGGIIVGISSAYVVYCINRCHERRLSNEISD